MAKELKEERMDYMEKGAIIGKSRRDGGAAKKLKFDLHTGLAWVIWAVLLTWAYNHPNPQFNTYAIWLTTGTAVYTGKRLLQKRKEFNGGISQGK